VAARVPHPDRACPHARGQATVELALVLPLVVFGLMAVLQVGLIVRDQVAVIHAAREAARAASVDRDPGRAVRLGEPITVAVEYHARTDLPLVGPLFPDPDLRAKATMRVER
jgi:hypothetical protein